MIFLPYCTYITFYGGTKLPPFYIGYTKTWKYINSFDAYRGSVSSKKYKQIWKEELKNNPHLFKTIPLTFHLTSEEAIEKEIYFQKQLNVVKNSMYINQGIGSIKFFNNVGVIKTEEVKKKISENRKGKGGNGSSPETFAKISESLKGHTVSKETRLKISETLKKRKLI